MDTCNFQKNENYIIVKKRFFFLSFELFFFSYGHSATPCHATTTKATEVGDSALESFRKKLSNALYLTSVAL